MNKTIYLIRKSYVKYDDDHYLLYLSEQQIDNYQPENTPGTSASPSSSDTQSEEAAGITAFSYEGTEPDGSTKIAAQEATYGAFTAGLVRLKYSQDEVEAILANKGDGNEEHQKEFDAYQAWRIQAKEMAKEVLEREQSN